MAKALYMVPRGINSLNFRFSLKISLNCAPTLEFHWIFRFAQPECRRDFHFFHFSLLFGDWAPFHGGDSTLHARPKPLANGFLLKTSKKREIFGFSASRLLVRHRKIKKKFFFFLHCLRLLYTQSVHGGMDDTQRAHWLTARYKMKFSVGYKKENDRNKAKVAQESAERRARRVMFSFFLLVSSSWTWAAVCVRHRDDVGVSELHLDSFLCSRFVFL